MGDRLIWVAGDKKKGLSVKKMLWGKKPQWRVGVWRGGKLYRVEDYPTRAEAMEYAKDRKRMGWYD